MMCKPYNERRIYRSRKWEYLLDDDDKTAWIVKGHIGRCKRFLIPECVDADGQSYTITSIELGAFNRPKTLKHLAIPDSIEYVDEDEFIFMTNLRSVYIGKGIKNLTDWHFRRGKGSVSLFIDKENPNIKPSNNLLLTSDGKTVLRTLKYCRKYIIPDGVERIQACAMCWNKMLEEASLPNTLKVVGDNGLSNNPKLRRLTFPEGFETFDVQGLIDNIGLEYLDLPSTLKRLTDSLRGCTGLKTLIIRTNYVFDDPHLDVEDLPRDCQILVPDYLVDEYKRHPVWGSFNIGSYVMCKL